MSFGLASFLSTFIPAIIGVICLGKTDSNFKYFTYFLFLILIIECISNYLFYTHQPNVVLYTFALFIETLFITLLLARNTSNKNLRLIILISTAAYLICFFYKLNQIDLFNAFDTELRILTCILIIFASGISIVQQSKNMDIFILSNPLFILSFALLLYYAATLFVHGALNLILQKSFQLVAKSIWNAHSVVNIITNILFAFSIWLSYRQKKLSL